MELTSPKNIKELLARYEARPSKGLGQNFLIDKNILNKIVEAANIKDTDTILEVGPGLGVLTKELAKKAEKVIAIEKDQTMIEVLKETLKDFTNVEVFNEDILQLNPTTKNFASIYKIVANIPYYLTSPLIRKFLELEVQPQEMVLMLQKEVAQRICAKPPKMSLLAVSVQFYAEAKIVFNVSKSCFWPAPKVDSAIIKIIPFGAAQGRPKISADLFFKVVKAGFSQPRKQLTGNLSKNLEISKEKTADWLLKNNIEPQRRAETLSIEEWINLAKSFQQ